MGSHVFQDCSTFLAPVGGGGGIMKWSWRRHRGPVNVHSSPSHARYLTRRTGTPRHLDIALVRNTKRTRHTNALQRGGPLGAELVRQCQTSQAACRRLTMVENSYPSAGAPTRSCCCTCGNTSLQKRSTLSRATAAGTAPKSTCQRNPSTPSTSEITGNPVDDPRRIPYYRTALSCGTARGASTGSPCSCRRIPVVGGHH